MLQSVELYRVVVVGGGGVGVVVGRVVVGVGVVVGIVIITGCLVILKS